MNNNNVYKEMSKYIDAVNFIYRVLLYFKTFVHNMKAFIKL